MDTKHGLDCSLFTEVVDRSNPEPAHAQIRRRVRELIRSGRLVEGHRLPAEPELADALGVSRMTANKAILSLVQEGLLTRERGRGTFVARIDLIRKLRCTIALTGDPERAIEDYYFGALYLDIQRRLSDRGADVRVVRYAGSPWREPERHGDGALLFINPPQPSIPDLVDYARGCGPVVVVGSAYGGPGISRVDSDNVLGAMMAVQHLIGLGHRRIGFLGACPGDSNTCDRLRGYQSALLLNGLVARPEDTLMLGSSRVDEPGERDAVESFVRAEDRPTALFAAGAVLGMAAVSAAHKARLSIPEQISVVAYDDPHFLSVAFPPVTTIRQPLSAMAEAAVAEVVRRVEVGATAHDDRFLTPELVVRASTQALPEIKP